MSVCSAQAESLRCDIPPSSQVLRLISAALCETKAYPLALLHSILLAYSNHPLMPSDLRQGGATIPARLVRYLFTVVIMPGRSPNTEYRSFGTATRVSALSPCPGPTWSLLSLPPRFHMLTIPQWYHCLSCTICIFKLTTMNSITQ